MRFSKSIILLLFFGVSSLPLFAQGMPDSIMNARNNAPEDYLVGIGVAKAETDWESLSLAETLARAQIARAIESIVSRTINEYSAVSEISGDSLYFTEEITEAHSIVNMKNSWIVELVKESDGTWWCVVYLDTKTL